MDQTPGRIIREVRKKHRLTQKQLAIRAGTAQAAISRVENDQISPTFENFKTLLLVMGEKPQISTERLGHDLDPIHLADNALRSPSERFNRALGWNRMLARFADEGRRIRGEV